MQKGNYGIATDQILVGAAAPCGSAAPLIALASPLNTYLIGQLQGELDMAWTARSKHGVRPSARRCSVRRGAGTTELSAVACIRVDNTGNWEVWMIKEIEELRPELGGVPLLEFPLLRYREIH